jgi:hypothetical protein
MAGGGPLPPNFTPFEDEQPQLSASGVAGSTTLFVLVASVLAMGLGADAQRILLTVTLSLSIYALVNHSPVVGLPAVIAYQAMIGGIKRYALPILGYSSYDPFLIVAPAVVIMMFIARVARKDVPRDTPLSKGVFVMLGIMFLEIFNPLQGGLLVGIAGALYCIVPMMWFYAGRNLGNERVVSAVFSTVVVVAVLGGVYGLKQQFLGFSDVEWQWLKITKNDNGLYITSQVMRVFSFFGSFAEYASFMVIGSVVCFAYLIKKNRMMVIPYAFLMVAVIYSSGRGMVLTALFGSCLVWSVMGRDPRAWVPRVALALVIGFFALTTGLRQTQTLNTDVTTETLLEHQRRGLLAPLDAKTSTGGGHVNLILHGIQLGFTNPLGQGLGAPTIVAGKLSGSGWGSEADFSDIFISCGAIGGIAYLYLIVTSLRTALTFWHKTRNLNMLLTFGVLFVTVGAWSVSARYAAPLIVWFLVGYLDRLTYNEMAAKAAEKQKEALAKKQQQATAGGIPGRA